MRRRQIRAIFFDIDGTLRDFDTKRVPDSTKEALRKAKEAGILLFVATGRHKLEIEEENLLEDMEFDAIIPAVQSGKADFGMAGMTVTPERAESINFTDSYCTGVQSIIVLK